MPKLTIVEYFGKDDTGSSCGYCKKSDGSLSHGMWAHCLTCQDYQDLLDRGWRRSGKYCYKPLMSKTCCPQYTIRLDVTGTKLRKSQKKVIKYFNKYVATGIKPAQAKDKETMREEPDDGAEPEIKETPNLKMKSKLIEMLDGVDGPIKGADLSKPKCKKAKERRKERKITKQEQESTSSTSNNTSEVCSVKKSKNKEKSLEEWIEEIPVDSKLKTKVLLVRCSPENSVFKETFEQEFQIYKKYQVKIHNDDPDEVDRQQFKRFLCDGPLLPVEHADDDSVPSCGLGAFHQLHFLDDKLIAVGVLDILPNSVSSKYLFYDPDYRFLSLGTYTALREIYFIRSLQRECPKLKYYYMGFYIQSCQKMRYKGKFSPSYLLCPESYRWQPIENCFDKLDASKYARLEEEASIVPEKYDINKTLCWYKSQYMTFQIFRSLLDQAYERAENEKTLKEYTQLTGEASQSILLYRTTNND